MDYISEPIAKLINQLSKLPGIGPKSAQRLAFFIISQDEQDVRNLAESIFYAKKKTAFCKICSNLTEGELCVICKSPSRNRNLICVVSSPKDVIAIERTHEFNGVYHILHGSISPLSGIGPDEINIKGLLSRLSDPIEEIILATNTDIEGEATAVYISRLLKPYNIKTTRIAHGVPVGGNLEYADEFTIIKAFENRQQL